MAYSGSEHSNFVGPTVTYITGDDGGWIGYSYSRVTKR